MDHYLTTYRKDYLWPNLPGAGGSEGGGGIKTAESAPKQTRGYWYRDIGTQYHFIGFGVETLGPWGPNAQALLKDLSKRLKDSTRPKGWHFSRSTDQQSHSARKCGQRFGYPPTRNEPAPYPRVPRLSGQELAFYQACMQHTRPPDCRCPQNSGIEVQLPPGKEGGWSRNEIMGPLLDPKLYPVRVGAAPETPTSRYDQPNAFLDKLQSKYPMLYSILQNEASPELKQRIDRDRNKTTYQVDYCESGPGAKFEGLQRAADESGTGPCAQPMRLPGDPCRVGPKPKFSTPKTISKQGGAGGGVDPRSKCETTSATPPLGKTEYQDGVSKLGAIIMRDKLHRKQ